MWLSIFSSPSSISFRFGCFGGQGTDRFGTKSVLYLLRPTVGDEIGGKVFKSEQKQNKAKLSDKSYSMPPRSRSVVINSLICRKSEITSS